VTRSKQRNLPMILLMMICQVVLNFGHAGKMKSSRIKAPAALIPDDTVLKIVALKQLCLFTSYEKLHMKRNTNLSK